LFLKGRPLNVTGLDFGPDGAMYFTTGGRRTQSGLYRVTFARPSRENVATPSEQKGSGAFAGSAEPNPWTRLNDADPWVRHAARVTLEGQPAAEWSEKALRESRPTAALTALLALSRAGEKALQPRILARLAQLSSALTPEQQLIAIRALGVCFLRMGKPDAAPARSFAGLWEPQYPATDARVNQALCELLVYLESTNVVRKTIPLLATAKTQEEKFHYLFILRLAKSGWTLDERRIYFDWLHRARTGFNGANMLPTALNYIRADAEATLSEAERAALAEPLTALHKPTAQSPPAAIPRSFIKDWSMDDLERELGAVSRGRDLARGKRLFAETGCAQCHRLAGEGGFVGPDLTAVTARFDRRTLLESTIEPSRVVAEIYRTVTVTTKSGAIVDGRVVEEDAKAMVMAINPVDPDQRRRVAKSEVVSRQVSDVSPMPAGLLNTLTREEVFDLLAWIESGGK
jgi:putative heme-binding domain-containing protein